jgi:N-acyl-D-amino-acid deacylase
MSDILVRNGHIVDGTGSPWFKTDILIEDEKIWKIGRNLEKSESTIDASGLIVCPGFIDIHGHSDYPILINPKAESKIHQGVTTEIIGNCGTSAAPLKGSTKQKAKETLKNYNQKLEWTNLAQYLNHIEKNGTTINLASFVGQGTIRESIMGYEARKPTTDELEEMKQLVEEAMKQGAWGLSSMPQFPPGSYADTDEIVELAKVSGRYGGIYATHIRTWNYQGLKEAVEIGERANIPVEINHYGSSVDKEVEVGFQILYNARNRGIDVTFDLYPYLAGSGHLSQGIPDWAFEGGNDKFLENLKNPETRKKIKEEWAVKLNELYRGDPWNKDYIENTKWGLMISDTRGDKSLEGRFIAEIADEIGRDPYDVALDILIKTNGQAIMVGFHIREWNIEIAMKEPISMFCSDAVALTPKGILGQGKPHPRSYGTYPKILARYVREKNVLRLEDAIRKMSSLPAQRVGLPNRGIIKEGMYADIVIFDYDKIQDTATYIDPHQFPKGIYYVIVNGTIVIEEGEHTNKFPGKPLRKKC